MGQVSLKIIDYEKARKWMGPEEEKLVKEAFDRLAVYGHLGKDSFRNNFLGSANLLVPAELANCIFDAFHVSAEPRGITWEDFMCGLAVLKHGTAQHKARLLFNIYDHNREGYVTISDLQRFLRLLETTAMDAPLPSTHNNTMDVDQFVRWATKKRAHALVSWLYELEDSLCGGGDLPGQLSPVLTRTQSTIDRAQKRQIHQLIQETGLSESEVGDLCSLFSELTFKSPHDVVDDRSLKAALPTMSPYWRQRLLIAFDLSGSGTLSLTEFVTGFATCLVGTDGQRRQLCLRLLGRRDEMTVEAARELKRVVHDGGMDALCAQGDVQLDGFEVAGETVSDMSWDADGLILVRRLGYLVRADCHLHPADKLEERMIVDGFNKKFYPQEPGPAGATWYAISIHWWHHWCRFTGEGSDFDPPSPMNLPRTVSITSSGARQSGGLGAIDNTPLLDERGKLKNGLSHGVHYELLPEICWQVLNGWYTTKGAEIPCRVIELDGALELEVYPLRFDVWSVEEERTSSRGSQPKVLECSKVIPMCQLRKEARKLFYFYEREVHLYHRVDNGGEWYLVPEEGTPHSLNIFYHDLLVDATRNGLKDRAREGNREDQKVVGLRNLGNTCYMNATLQCLSHLRPIQKYFLKQYTTDLHPTSQRSLERGMGGKLAVAFADLLSDVSSAREAVAPSRLKDVMGHFNMQFAGSDQQDAEEFLSSILECLGEDLNRVIENPPYIELKDSGNRTDVDVAQEYWDVRTRRDWSIIPALFYGQFKSTLRCSVCGLRNAKFDDFGLIPVPLPEHDFKWVTCTIVELGPRKKKVTVRLAKSGTVEDVKRAVSGMSGYAIDELVAAEVSRDQLYISNRVAPYERIWDGILLFQTPANFGDAFLQVEVMLLHRRLTKIHKYFLNPYRTELFATPQVVKLQTCVKARDMYEQVWRCSRLAVPDLHRGTDSSYPFKLCRVKRDGSTCSICGWREGCQGHYVPCDDQEVLFEKSYRLEEFDTLALDWDGDVLSEYYNDRSVTAIDLHESVELAKIEQDAPEQLDTCLDAFLGSEELSAYCRTCTSSAGDFTETKQEKMFRIWALPPILVFQLKRFRNVNGLAYKLQNMITYPLQLDATKYLDVGPTDVAGSTLSRENTRYSLHAVVYHLGSTSNSGHYVASVRRPDGQWTYCDDSRCSDRTEKEVVTDKAYLLFYVRADIESADVSHIFPEVVPAEGVTDDTIEAMVKQIRNSKLGDRRGQKRPRSPRGEGTTGMCVVS